MSRIVLVIILYQFGLYSMFELELDFVVFSIRILFFVVVAVFVS
jgi:hypothetical protein